MAKVLRPTATSFAYATALLELANERKLTDQIAGELGGLRQVLAENPSFRTYLSDPSVGDNERSALLKKVFAGKVTPLLEHFLEVLGVKDRLGDLGQIADAFDHLLDEQNGKIEVDVTVAHQLTAEQLEQVRQKVSSALKKDAIVQQNVDESIIGGIILKVKDQLIDASVKTQLTALRRKLLAAN